MRHNQNRRSRGRSRKGPNPLTRSFESNGPDVKVRGTAAHVAEKYMTLARDAISSGDIVAAENYYQHAEHYNRIVAAAQAQFQQSQPQPFRDSSEDGDDEERSFNGRGSYEGGGYNGGERYDEDDDRAAQGYNPERGGPDRSGPERGGPERQAERGQGYDRNRQERGQQSYERGPDRVGQDRGGQDRAPNREGQRQPRRFRNDEQPDFAAREGGRNVAYEGRERSEPAEPGEDNRDAPPTPETPKREARGREAGNGGEAPAPKPRRRRERAQKAVDAESGDEPQSDGQAALAAFPD